MALAGLHVGEILRTYKLCQRLTDREQKRLRGLPPADRLKLEGSVRARAQGNDPAEGFIAFEEPISAAPALQKPPLPEGALCVGAQSL